jgi:hypothetical protein
MKPVRPAGRKMGRSPVGPYGGENRKGARGARALSLVAADVNLDGKPDLVTGSFDQPKVGVFLNVCP